MTMSNLYKQELVKLSNSIQTIKKHETSFEGMIKFILVQKVFSIRFRMELNTN